MPVHVALLRAINVGGTGKLPMADLRAICEGLGFSDVATYIQSGNVLFRSDLKATDAENLLDEKYFNNSYEKAFYSGVQVEPSVRRFGVSATYKFF